MNAVVIYSSQFGNTRQVAEAIATALGEQANVRLLEADTASPADMQDAQLLAVGGPTQAHGINETLGLLLERLPDNALDGVVVLAFDTRFAKPRWLTGSAAVQLAHRLTNLGGTLLLPAESFYVLTKRGPLQQGDQQRATQWARQALAKLGGRLPMTA